MTYRIEIEKTGLTTWIATDRLPVGERVVDRCTVEALSAALRHVDGAEVVSATVNDSGVYQPPEPPPGFLPEGVDMTPLTGLPVFCDVRVLMHGPGGHAAEKFVWVPLAWNERFMGTAGGGAFTGPVWLDIPFLRNMTMAHALRNGFATAATDGAVPDWGDLDYPIDPVTGEFDWELVRNWTHRSTHDMTIVGKAVTAALHGRPPRYSYLAGGSGGGRQVLASAQRYPADYDGLWSVDPAVNWPKVIGAGLWPALVMKEEGTALPPAKLDAFRSAALEACDGADGVRDGFVGAFEPFDFAPHTIVGTGTEAGVITDADAEVIRRIWDGPRRTNGERLWYGIRPGVSCWTEIGLCATVERDGVLVPKPNPGILAHFRWVTRDRAFDWTSLTYHAFEKLFDQGAGDFAETSSDEPDLSGLRDSGAKLIISQATDDEVLPFENSLDYYRRVVDSMGGLDETTGFARLFLTDGDVHTFSNGPGPGISVAAGMVALMEWVEHGRAPEMIIAERVDPRTTAVTGTRPAFPYPAVTRYSGSGDPAESASYLARGL
ncbi:tannase/feruloyl esterase family alpha/beta hydrolase [Streptomyces sp. NPDC051985]|uniref:tannase/feruloyl esterase family alpha/beta hydrolase n=1 Tax=Streptomyces sp. NPDC051985 TaxID=3155807 RepID=UPI0034151DD8